MSNGQESRKRKKRNVCEENISKLNLDEVEFNMLYFSGTSEGESDGSNWTPHQKLKNENEKLKIVK